MFRVLLFNLMQSLLEDLKESRLRYKRLMGLRSPEDDVYGDREWIVRESLYTLHVWILFLASLLAIRWIYDLLIQEFK